MNNNQAAGNPADSAPALHLLRQARESRGVHIAALSVALKVPVKKLEALEEGRYDELPGLTFARALASSACRHLKVDAAPVLSQIPVASSQPLGYADTSVNTPFRPPSESSTRQPVWLSRPALGLALALVVGSLLLVFWPESATTDLATSEVKGPETVVPPLAAPVPAIVVEPTAPAAVNSAGVPVSAAPALVEPAAVPPAPAAPSTPVTAATSAPQAAPTVTSVMSIRANSESWVEVTNASGAVLLKRLLKSGEVVDFASAPPFSVLLGRVDAAEVTVRGQPFDTAPFARNSVARFEVK